MVLSWQSPIEPIDGRSPDSLASLVKVHDVNWTPWSEWITVSDSGDRFEMAMPSALVARAAVWLESIDQPTTRRECTSSTTAQYTLPSRVGCSVMSVTHNWFGAGLAKSRSTGSTAVGVSCFGRGLRRLGRPLIPLRRMRSAMVLCPTVIPRPRVIWACTRGEP